MGIKSSTELLLENIANTVDATRDTVSQMRDVISGIQVEIGKHTEILAEHIRRTELSEENLKILRADHLAKTEKLEKDLIPLKKHMQMFAGVGKLVTIISAIAVAAAAIYELFWK